MLKKRALVPVMLVSLALVLGACSKSLNVEDLQLEEDLTNVVEVETGGTVSDVQCPETIEDAEAGKTFTCDLEMDDGSTVTVNLELEEEDDGDLIATYQGIE